MACFVLFQVFIWFSQSRNLVSLRLNSYFIKNTERKRLTKLSSMASASRTFHPSVLSLRIKKISQWASEKFDSYFKASTRPSLERNWKGNKRGNRASRKEACFCTKDEEMSAIENKNYSVSSRFSSAYGNGNNQNVLHNNRLIDVLIVKNVDNL